jgi:hypothetical protein
MDFSPLIQKIISDLALKHVRDSGYTFNEGHYHVTKSNKSKYKTIELYYLDHSDIKSLFKSRKIQNVEHLKPNYVRFISTISSDIYDLSKDPIPEKYRLYHPNGDHIGRNGGKYFDKRLLKKKTNIIQDPSLISPITLINSGGVFSQSKRKVKTHDGEHILSISAHYKLSPELLIELDNTATEVTEQIEQFHRQGKISDMVFTRAKDGISIAEDAVEDFVGYKGHLPSYLEKDPDLLFISRDENNKIRGACHAKLKEGSAYIEYLGTYGLSGGGSGTALLHEVIAWAAANRREIVELYPLKDAKEFYLKHKFEPIEESKNYKFDLNKWNGVPGHSIDEFNPKEGPTPEEKSELIRSSSVFGKEYNIDQAALIELLTMYDHPEDVFRKDLIALEQLRSILALYDGNTVNLSELIYDDPLTSKIMQCMRNYPDDGSMTPDEYLDRCMADQTMNKYSAYRDVFDKQKISEVSVAKGLGPWAELSDQEKKHMFEIHFAQVFGDAFTYGDKSNIGEIYNQYLQGRYVPGTSVFDDYVGSPEFLSFVAQHREKSKKEREDPHTKQMIENYKESYIALEKKVKAQQEYIALIKTLGSDVKLKFAEDIVRRALPDYPEAIEAFRSQIHKPELDDDKLYADIYDIIMEANA